jgi:prepilin-type N-terminal cleavage/methylation domain-containing protein
MKLTNCFQNRKRLPSTRKAFTLLEVLVGVMLLGTLAVTILLGFKQHKRQLLFSEQRIQAVRECDLLLRNWTNLPTGIPRQAFGSFQPNRPWIWRTNPVQQRLVFGQAMEVVRMEIYENDQPSARRLVMVDVLQTVAPKPSGFSLARVQP